MVQWTCEYWTEQLVEKSLRLWNLATLSKEPQLFPQNIKRILICAYHGLGNFLLYTPTLCAIRKYFPEAQIDLQVGNKTGCEQVLEGSNYFRSVYDISSNATWQEWIQHIKKIRANKYDLIINEFHSNSQKLATMVSFSKAQYRLGHVRSPGWQDRYGFIYNLRSVMKEDQHEIDRYFGLARVLQIPEKLLVPETFITLQDEDLKWASNFLHQNKVPSQAILIGIQMGTSTNMSWKQWSSQKFRELCQHIIRNHTNVILIAFGSASEAKLIQETLNGLEKRVLFATEQTIKQTAALIKRCDLLVCNDSGLMHVAVAVGTPVVAIYGPTDYRRTAPLGQLHKIVRHDLPCSPCFRMNGSEDVLACPHKNCLTQMEVEEIFKAVEEQLNNLSLDLPT